MGRDVEARCQLVVTNRAPVDPFTMLSATQARRSIFWGRPTRRNLCFWQAIRFGLLEEVESRCQSRDLQVLCRKHTKVWWKKSGEQQGRASKPKVPKYCCRLGYERGNFRLALAVLRCMLAPRSELLGWIPTTTQQPKQPAAQASNSTSCSSRTKISLALSSSPSQMASSQSCAEDSLSLKNGGICVSE